LTLDPTKPTLTAEQKATLQSNIQLLRDAIVLFTATGAARGVSGHTGTFHNINICASSADFTVVGGAYDTVPEVCILLALFEGSDKFLPIVFDEAGTFLHVNENEGIQFLQVTVLLRNISSPLSKDRFLPSISFITAKPMPSSRATPSWD